MAVIPSAKLTLQTAIKLNNGVDMPLFGLGTFRLKGEHKARDAVVNALQMGYRHIDTAAIYKNEHIIANAIEDSKLHRDELFITSKLTPADHGFNKAIQACKTSLANLKTDYLDLYLIHWPAKKGLKKDSKANAEHRIESWKGLEKLYKDGLCKAIGVSNFTVEHLKQLLAQCTVVPAVNQVEFHPHQIQPELLAFCKEKGIVLEAYSSLGQGELVHSEDINAMAKKYKKTIPQILLRWAIQQNIPVIPKSSSSDRQHENLQVFDFELEESDMKELNALHKDIHYAWDPTGIL